MKRVFKNQNNNNFYYLKELQWTNNAMKIKKLQGNNNNQKYMNSINYLKEKSWNTRFIYNSIQNYDSSRDKNVIANLLGGDEMNCYHNAIKKNNLILKSFYSINKTKKKLSQEFGKTNIRINPNPLGKKNQKLSKLMNYSFSTNKLLSNKRMILDPYERKNDFNRELHETNNINPDKLSKLWNDLCVPYPYRELFNIILSQLPKERREDVCKREYTELNEIKHNLQQLSMSVYYRLKILEELANLNDKLGLILNSKETVSNEIILKKISKTVENLREHTVNICFLMKKIKAKIKEVHDLGKFDLDSISEKYKFDKNYLIKMKDEMGIFKEGYAKYFFKFGESNDPFLLCASKLDDNEAKNQDPFFHNIPITDEMKEDINQCIYIIYQELIGYKNYDILDDNSRNISPLKKYKYHDIDIVIFQKDNKNFNNNKIKTWNNNQWRNIIMCPNKTNYSMTYKPSNIILSGKTSENDNMDKASNYIKITNYNLNSNKNINNNINIDIKNKTNEAFYLNDENMVNDGNKVKIVNLTNYVKKIGANKPVRSNNEKIISNLNNEKNNNKNINKKNNNDLFNDKSKDKENNNINNNISMNKIEKDKTEKIMNKNIINKNKEKSSNNNENLENLNNLNKSFSKNESINEKYMNDSYVNKEESQEISEEIENQKDINSEKDKINLFNSYVVSMKSKKIEITIFNEDIRYFSKDFFPYYFTLIPKVIKEMFLLEKDLMKNITQGISPYLIILYENPPLSKEIDDNNWINYKHYILGMCAFSFEYKNNKIILNISHISNSIPFNPEEKNKEIKMNVCEAQYLFNIIIEYIKNNFYFDEILIRYDSSKINEQILKYFLNELNFVVVTEDEKEENGEEENITQNLEELKEKEKNSKINKMIYTNDSSKNRVDDTIKGLIQNYIGKNLLDILDSVLIASNTELMSIEQRKKNEAYLINNVVMKYLLEKKERTNVNRLYNKISNLDQLIKILQNHNINKKEIPLSLAENRFDIICSVLNMTTYNNYFSNSIFFNNYNISYPSSYYIKNTGIYYNFIKVEKMLVLENNKHHIKIYNILNNNVGVFFCKMSEEYEKDLSNNNIYIQINNLFKETIAMNNIQVLEDKIIWIPCFEINKHLKTLSKNGFGTIHEYIQISNKKINKLNRESFMIKSKKNKENKYFRIVPDLSNDILFEEDFIFGIVNNTDLLNDNFLECNNRKNIKKDEPYVIFLSCIKKSDFCIN